jgi:hypothetical protein
LRSNLMFFYQEQHNSKVKMSQKFAAYRDADV